MDIIDPATEDIIININLGIPMVILRYMTYVMRDSLFTDVQ